MNKKKIILIILCLLVIVGAFGLYQMYQRQKYFDLNQQAYDDFKSQIDSGHVDNCNHKVDTSLFPEVIELQSQCFYDQGMNFYTHAEFNSALNAFDQSLALSSRYSSYIEEMKVGIQLIIEDESVTGMDIRSDFDLQNEYASYYDLSSFILKYPFINFEQVLIKNKYIAQIMGEDTYSNGQVSFRVYAQNLFTDINYDNTNTSTKVYFIPYVSSSLDLLNWREYGVISLMDTNSNDVWIFRYKFSDVDTLILYSYADNLEYTLARVIK